MLKIRTDRFAARHSEDPLDMAFFLKDCDSSYKASTSLAFIERWMSTHPPASHRIKAPVQLYHRVPGPPLVDPQQPLV